MQEYRRIDARRRSKGDSILVRLRERRSPVVKQTTMNGKKSM